MPLATAFDLHALSSTDSTLINMLTNCIVSLVEAKDPVLLLLITVTAKKKKKSYYFLTPHDSILYVK